MYISSRTNEFTPFTPFCQHQPSLYTYSIQQTCVLEYLINDYILNMASHSCRCAFNHKLSVVSHYRLTATTVMDQLKKVYSDEEDPYDSIDLIDVIGNSDAEQVKFQDQSQVSPLQGRIQDIKV